MRFTAAFSSGAGGQSVNRTESKAIAHWNLEASQLFTQEEKARILSKIRSQLSTNGDFIVSSQVHRSQQMNKKECVQKLAEVLQKSLFIPKRRIKTKPSKSAKMKRVDSKKIRGKVKALRQNKSGWD